MTIDRSNDRLEAIVDQALTVFEQHGARQAAAYLTAHGAGFALTCRVLGEPARRRARLRHSAKGPSNRLGCRRAPWFPI